MFKNLLLLLKAVEIKEAEERTWEDYKYVADAYIMKILKQKKALKLEELIENVLINIRIFTDVFFINFYFRPIQLKREFYLL